MATPTLAAAAPSSALDRDTRPRFYHPEFDSLRFFAFFAVFLHHALPISSSIYAAHSVPRWAALPMAYVARAGAFGVDLFFLLSAYLITELLLREREATGRIRVPAFYARRILRIWPLYFFVLGIALALPHLGFDQKFSGKEALAFALFSGNWYFATWGALSSIANPLWSVSLEEQFYITWPLVLRRLSERGIVIFGALLAATSSVARAIAVARHAHFFVIERNTFLRLEPMALGMILAVLLRHTQMNLGALYRWMLGTAGVIGIIWAAHFGDNLNSIVSPRSAVFAYPVVAISCALIFVAVFSAGLASRFFALRPMVYLGKISYGLYAYHLLALLLVGSMVQHQSGMAAAALRMFAGLALTILIAAASYRWLESPFLRLKEKFSRISSRPV